MNNGSINYSDNSGCTAQGQLADIDTNHDLVSVTGVNFSGCSMSGTANGLAWLDTSVSPSVFYVFIQSNGAIFFLDAAS